MTRTRRQRLDAYASQFFGSSPGGGGGGTTTNPLTINNSGAGAASGATFNGIAPVTISYNTVGAQPLTWLQASVTLTAAQIRAFTNATATSVTLVAAPGAGNIIEILYCSSNYHFNANFATGTQQIILGIDNGGAVQVHPACSAGVCQSATIVTGGVSTYTICADASSAIGDNALAVLINKALLLNIAGLPQYTLGGTSTLLVNVFYRIMAVS